MSAVDACAAGTTAPPTSADSEALPDFWNLIARMVRVEQVGISTWWVLAEGSHGETALGVAHLDAQRIMSCRWTKEGDTIIGRHEIEFRSILSGILTARLSEVES